MDLLSLLIVIVLCLFGVLLILLEIFVIPGITLAAIAGVACCIGGIYYAFRWKLRTKEC